MQLTLTIPDDVAARLQAKGVQIPAYVEEMLAKEAHTPEFARPADPARQASQETMQDRLNRALAALGPIDTKWEGDTDSYMAFIRGED